jgi:hypothetical protein
MAKQKRIGTRPGQRPPLQRTTTRTSRPPDAVSPEEEARAAELEAQILAEEKAAEDAQKSRDRRAKAPVEGAIYSSAPLAQRAAEEYAYVQRDLRRILVVGGGLLIALAVIYVLLNVLNVV